VTVEIPALVQNTDDIDVLAGVSIEYDMRTDTSLAIAWPDVFARLTGWEFATQSDEAIHDLADVSIGSGRPPAFTGKAPDFL
jgi:hypothetical protein